MSTGSRVLLLVIYGGTGMTALAYEILWTRMLSLMFGISIFGVVLTVTAFMAGLGIGSMLGTRYFQHFASRPALLVVAALEAAIALYAMAVPFAMPWLDQGLLDAGAGWTLAAWQGLQAFTVLLLLLPAALAMGFAFPMALRAAEGLRLPLSAMYGINTIGGALGAMLPLLLLPLMGWAAGLRMVAVGGLMLAVLAGLLSVRAKSMQSTQHSASGVERPPWSDLLFYAGIGAAALMLEVIWTREYGMVLLRTEYVLAVLLLVYLSGIGLGSLIARTLDSQRWLNILPVASAILILLGQYMLSFISQWANRTSFDSLMTAMAAEGGMVLLVTLPVTLALGAWMPLLAHRFEVTRENQQATSTSGVASGGWWYGANSLGAALGAMLAGFVLLPWVGAAASLVVASLLLLFCGLRWVNWIRNRQALLLVPVLIALIWPIHNLPQTAELLPSLAGSRDISLYEDAVALTHVVELPDGQRVLLSDLQRMDASSDPTAVTVQKNQARLPLLLHPNPRSLLLLGMGTGITAAGSLPYQGLSRTSVELSQGAIQAADQAFTKVNGHVTEHMRVLHDDARRFLRTSIDHYDVIIGDLFHPDMVGRANLLSLQQFSRARARLNEGGVFVQWLALNQFDIATLKVVMQTFRQAFTQGESAASAMVFVDGYRVALVGIKGAANAEVLLRKFERMPEATRSDATGGEGFWTWMGRYWGEIPDFSSQGVRLQDEWAPVIEFSLPQVRYRGGVKPLATWRWLLSWRENAERAEKVWHIPSNDRITYKRAWASAALDVRLWMSELAGDDRQMVKWARLSHRANPDDRWPAFALADRMFASLEQGLPDGLSRRQALKQILKLRSDHVDALRAMMVMERQDGNEKAANKWRDRLQAVSPLAFDVRER